MNIALKWISGTALSAALVWGLPAGLNGQDMGDAVVDEEAPAAANGVVTDETPAAPQWTDVQTDALPDALLASIEQAAPGARVVEGRQRQRGEDGVQYDLVLDQDGKRIDADIRLAGENVDRGTLRQTLGVSELPAELLAAAEQHVSAEQLGQVGDVGERVVQKVTSIDRRGRIQMSYEWSLGRGHRFTLSPEGEVQEREQIREAENLPPEILHAVQASYPERSIGNIERVVENGETSFRMRIEDSAEGVRDRQRITVDPEGQITEP